MTPPDRARLEEIKKLKANSTRVVAWYDHGGTVRGPFNRWFEVTRPEEEVQCGDIVRAHGHHDTAYCAAAMNETPWLITQLEAAWKREEIARKLIEDVSKWNDSDQNTAEALQVPKDKSHFVCRRQILSDALKKMESVE